MRYQWAIYNIIFGLANHEMKTKAMTELNLIRMRDLIKNSDDQDISTNLFRVLSDEQRFALRSLVREPVRNLLGSTITELKLESLNRMTRNLYLLIQEEHNKNIVLTIQLQEKIKCNFLARHKKTSVLLKIEIPLR